MITSNTPAIATINSLFANNGKIVVAMTVRPQAEAANKAVGNYKSTALVDGKIVEAERPRTLRMEYTGSDNLQSGQSVALVISDMKNPSAGSKYADCKGVIVAAGGQLKDLWTQAEAACATMPATPADDPAPF